MLYIVYLIFGQATPLDFHKDFLHIFFNELLMKIIYYKEK